MGGNEARSVGPPSVQGVQVAVTSGDDNHTQLQQPQKDLPHGDGVEGVVSLQLVEAQPAKKKSVGNLLLGLIVAIESGYFFFDCF